MVLLQSYLLKKRKKLVEYAVHMEAIGYGCTHEKILDIVSEIVSKDGRPNPFVNGTPGRKWWVLFKKRHYVYLRSCNCLELSAVPLKHWVFGFKDFREFLEMHSLLN